jgi:hypothetical protein
LVTAPPLVGEARTFCVAPAVTIEGLIATLPAPPA